MEETLTIRPRKWRRAIRRMAIGGGVLLVVLLLLALFWFRHALYNRLVRFPGEARAWAALEAQRLPVTNDIGWREFRGVLHSHSELSHDSEVPFEEILAAVKSARADFICLSDHCDEGRADFSRQWRGIRDGVLFIPGFEMREGYMPFGVASGVVLSNATESGVLARQIVEQGGVLFFAHPEEKRDWDRPELTGMEIYNLHADFKTHGGKLSALLPDVVLSQRKYPDQVMRTLFHRPEAFLRRWDELNRTRHIVGIAGNDCHQNTGFRGFYTTNDTLRVEDTSPETLKEWKLNGFTRALVRLCFGRLDPGRKLFHLQLDPYPRMARFVNTHVLARDLTESGILDALRAGRAFVGFDMVADSTGFQWLAVNDGGTTVMGESGRWERGTRLIARSPLPCRFTVVQDGQPAYQQRGRTLEWTPHAPGKFRVEAELEIRGEWVPWVYTNPIELRYN